MKGKGKEADVYWAAPVYQALLQCSLLSLLSAPALSFCLFLPLTPPPPSEYPDPLIVFCANSMPDESKEVLQDWQLPPPSREMDVLIGRDIRSLVPFPKHFYVVVGEETRFGWIENWIGDEEFGSIDDFYEKFGSEKEAVARKWRSFRGKLFCKDARLKQIWANGDREAEHRRVYFMGRWGL